VRRVEGVRVNAGQE